LVHSNAFLDKTKIWIGPIDKQREKKKKKKKKEKKRNKLLKTRQRSTEHAITYCWLADTTGLHKSYKAMERNPTSYEKER
jgi:hypothetical protein